MLKNAKLLPPNPVILRSVATKNLLLEDFREKQILLPLCGISMTRTGLSMTGNAAQDEAGKESK